MTDAPWREEWDRQADDWVELTTDDPFYDLLNKPAFLDLVPEPGVLTLDVGCGEGRLGRELVARGHRVVGVDGASSLARLATRATPPLPVAVGDASSLPVRAAVADLVVCFMVLMDVEARCASRGPATTWWRNIPSSPTTSASPPSCTSERGGGPLMLAGRSTTISEESRQWGTSARSRSRLPR